MVAPLRIPERGLDAHFRAVSKIIASNVDSAANIELLIDWNILPLVAGVAGDGCETTFRNRGRQVPLAPLLLLGSGLWAWLGYREEWDNEPPAGRTRRYSFRSSGLTIHFGYKNLAHKPQIFRAEWSGWARWSGDDYSYQAGQAGHPHWQFDAVESLKRDDAAERAQTYLSVLKSEQADMPLQDFSPQALTDEDIYDLIGTQKLSRMHFASAAHWWRNAPDDAHAHAPCSVREVQSWLENTLSYIRLELTRLS